MPPAADAVTDVLTPITYTPAQRRERRPVPWRTAALVVAVAVGVPAVCAWVAFCVKVILIIWG